MVIVDPPTKRDSFMHCTPDRVSIGTLLVEKNVYNLNPPYQRESGIWSDEKQQLFLDSLFNRYDVPKVYLHDLRGRDPRYHFAVIDGKQRLNAIWNFLEGEIALASDFELYDPGDRQPPPAGARYVNLSPEWQEIFKSRHLDVVYVQNADEEDIEDLFSRLNNGEPLNAAEKRNALGGDMNGLVRKVARHVFFTDGVSFANRRYQHYEVAAKFLLMENAAQRGGEPFVDLKKKYLDRLVTDNRNMTTAQQDALFGRVDAGLASLNRVFGTSDPLLSKQAYPPLYYLFVRQIETDYADPQLHTKIRTFLERFHALRAANLNLPEDSRDPVLIEFGRLMQQGTNDKESLRTRVSILRRYFLQEMPDVRVRDARRAFTPEERFAIWVLGGKRCAECGVELPDIDDMDADHQLRWAHGGETTLRNGRCLCVPCNRSGRNTVEPRDA